MSELDLGQVRAPSAVEPQRALRSSVTRFDWLMMAACSWPIAGAYLDAWAHAHVLKLETFFTPYHAVLYSGIFTVTLVMAVAFALGVRRTRSLTRALPRGYGLSWVGCLMFLLVGPGDLTWHTIFGIERDYEAVMSPTHIAGMLALALIVSGPLRASWARPGREIGVPAIVSTSLLISTMSTFQAFNHPFVRLLALWNGAAGNGVAVATSLGDAEQIGVLAILVEAALLTAIVLLLARRFQLPWGTFGFVFGLNAALLSAIGDQYWMIAVAAVAGLGADTLLRVLAVKPDSTFELRVVGAAVPLLLFGLYFATISFLGPISWPIHVWAGSIVVSAIAGWLISCVIVPRSIGPESRVGST